MSWLDGRSVHQVLVTGGSRRRGHDLVWRFGRCSDSTASPRCSCAMCTTSCKTMYWRSATTTLTSSARGTTSHDRPCVDGRRPIPPFRLQAPRQADRLVPQHHAAEVLRPVGRRDDARLLDSGRASLEALRDRTALALADSSLNAADLHDAGYRLVRVAVDPGGREAARHRARKAGCSLRRPGGSLGGTAVPTQAGRPDPRLVS